MAQNAGTLGDRKPALLAIPHGNPITLRDW
jgi:hypothetical protein